MAAVSNDAALQEDELGRPVLPWRLVAGAFLHFVLPFYLVAVVIAVLHQVPHDAVQLLHLMLRASPMLLAGYAAVAFATTAAAALIDPILRKRRLRRAASDPMRAALHSERRLASAVSQGRAMPDPRAQAALQALAAARWNHRDPRYQALARDLLELVESSVRSLATVSADRRQAMLDMTAVSLEHIAAAQAELTAADAQENETQARIVSGYVEARYASGLSTD